jgi:squalene-hopene/tetraprenyl-beta-curcumene cyclase
MLCSKGRHGFHGFTRIPEGLGDFVGRSSFVKIRGIRVQSDCVLAPDSEDPVGWRVVNRSRLEHALETARAHLLDERNAAGHWTGELSASALSTATAVVALELAARNGAMVEERSRAIAARGLRWLAAHANGDGGWGDTVLSRSNVSTTTLVRAAFFVRPDLMEEFGPVLAKAEAWLTDHCGAVSPDALAAKIVERYGDDRTFSVPILTLCALSGRFGDGPEAWRHVIPLPFELAVFPPQLFAALRLPVVSYALPALIAIGYARHFHAPTPGLKWLRNAATARAFRVLDSIQPPNGGFLEATPLTSFVTMSLVASGQAAHPVVRRGLAFLEGSAQSDGSWRIDTNLATWVTSLSVHALAACKNDARAVDAPQVKDWLLGQQYGVRHPYTNAAPGGWAWTDLPGGVPDADDTPGALLALRALGEPDARSIEAAAAGVLWLLDLQNGDGGIPTFCRGWGRLPFDRSSNDLTAHALRAWAAWRPWLRAELQTQIDSARKRALRFLVDQQEPSGAWCPLWFGNEAELDESNRIYGTSRVLLALADVGAAPVAAAKAAQWLAGRQGPDGGWGSVEETALAVEALAAHGENREAVERGTEWLIQRVEQGTWTQPSPIGFYFAKLWYFERLYPVVFTVAALGRVAGGKMAANF